MSCYHPDIMEFISCKEVEGKLRLSNLSVVVDDAFMELVKADGTYWTYFDYPDGRKLYQELKAKEVFNAIVEGAWKNGEPGLLFYDRINDSPYKYSGQIIDATNPCLVGDTLVQTVEGQIKIKDLENQSAYVYCMSDEGILTISKAFSIRKTKENAHLVRVQTSRGHIICTPDHKFYTRNRGYVQAKDLTVKDKIVGLNRKMHGEHYCSVSITGSKVYEKEHRFIMRHFEDITSKDVHHKDENYLNNVKDNLEVLTHKYHSSLTNKGHSDWNDHDERGYFIRKEEHKKKKQMKLTNGNPKGLNLVVLGVEELNYVEDVYDMEVEKFHNFFANGVLVHNCGEQPLPYHGSCNLGSIDVGKFVTDSIIDWNSLHFAVKLGVDFLDRVLDVNKYPTEEIEAWAKDNRPVGLGVMGLADLFMKLHIAYGSPESIKLTESLFNFMKEEAELESERLGKLYGVPNACKGLPIPRRNITCLTVAPTGSIAILAGCNSGIEPIFSEVTKREDKTGKYIIKHPEYDKEYFRCAVSSNGATEVTWQEHILIQDAVQKYVDSGVSKTCNFPNHTHKETIASAYMYAWKLGHIKGLTVYRNNSREKEVLSPKNLKKDKCPVCDADLILESGCKKCSDPMCGWSVCEVA